MVTFPAAAYEVLTGPFPRGEALRFTGFPVAGAEPVDLLLAGPRIDHPILRRAARSLLPRLLARGLGVYEYRGAMMHAKVALFDRRWAIVGTSNLDRQSFEHSYEVNLVLAGGDVSERLEAMFQDDRSRSQPVDAAALEARGPWERLVDRLASVVLRLI